MRIFALTVLSLGTLVTCALSRSGDGAEPGKKVYELRVYHCNPGKLGDLNKRFREHTVKLFAKHGIESVGYWTPIDEKDGKADTLYYLLAYPSREAATASWKAFRDDPVWQKVFAESHKDGVLVKKADSIFLDATDYSPTPATGEGSGEPRVFELRTYVASPGKMDAMNARFREHTLKLFAKHGLGSVGYWIPQDADKGKADTLHYLLSFPSKEAAGKSWKAFGDDPVWKKVYAESQADGVKLAGKITSVYLEPTDYSPMR